MLIFLSYSYNQYDFLLLLTHLPESSPPHFLRRQDSSSGSSAIDPGEPFEYNRKRQAGVHPTPALVHSLSAGCRSDDYRSVIDDLTIENRKLKRRLKKYEASRRPHLEKERLFEIKFHGLPSKKRRELEEQLSAFAASIEALDDCDKENAAQDARHASSSLTNSASNSRPADSGYNSMSNCCVDRSHSRPTSNANSDCRSPLDNATKGNRVETFLDHIPEGLLPKSMALSERQKKKLVVKRLEQLFAGRIAKGEHRQPVQQQEVSSMAAKADRETEPINALVEGVREAHMLTHPIDAGAMDVDTEDQIGSDQDLKPDSSEATFPGQRPTRPLDLDPHRAQIPSDNVDYIRHLGLSAPQFTTEESDENGWIYLNLLMSMAQLHIINVTADFVRSAVADVSEKFQLSSDGQKIRWKGGMGRTHMSSDSGNSSGKNQSPQDSDSLEETARKRHKVDRSKFATIPIGAQDSPLLDARISPVDSFHYKPIFHHRESSSGEENPNFDTDSYSSKHSGATSDNENGKSPKESRAIRSTERHRRNHGGIVFYNGAFCIDLSGDSRRRPSITTEAHEEPRDVLGCPRKRRGPFRTDSGSSLPSIPFKACTKQPAKEYCSSTSAPSADEFNSLDFSTEWPSAATSAETPLLPLKVSGIGGTHPDDHFALRVKTRRTVLGSRIRAIRSTRGHPQRRRLVNSIQKYLLNIPGPSERQSSPDSITRGVAALNTFRSPSPHNSHAEFPIKTEIVSTLFTRLDPSPLPAPSNFYGMASSSDESEDSDGSSSGGKSHSWQVQPQIEQVPPTDEEHEDEEIDDEEDETSLSEDSSIDMLAPARLAHPQLIAARERDFEREEAISMAVRSGTRAVSEDEESEDGESTPSST